MGHFPNQRWQKETVHKDDGTIVYEAARYVEVERFAAPTQDALDAECVRRDRRDGLPDSACETLPK